MHEHAWTCEEGVEDDPPPPEVTMTTTIDAGVADAVTPYRSGAVAAPTAPDTSLTYDTAFATLFFACTCR